MNKYSQLVLAGAAALAWSTIAMGGTAAADSASQTVRSRPVASDAIRSHRPVRVAANAGSSCQSIACPGYRLVGISY